MMREHQFRSQKKRPHRTPAFLNRLQLKQMFERLQNANAVMVEKDPVEEVAKLFAFVRENPYSRQAIEINHFLSAFDSKPKEEPAQSVSQLVVQDLMDYAAAKELLTLRFVDEGACQIEGGIPCISAFNEGHDGAVDEILLANFRRAAGEGNQLAAETARIVEASMWARRAARKANYETEQTIAALEKEFASRHPVREIG